MPKNTSLFLNLSCLLFFTVTSHAAPNTEAARVNDVVITVDAMNRHYNELYQLGTPGLSKKKALDDLIKKEVAVLEAKRLKLDQDPAIQERMNNVLYVGLLEQRLNKELDKVNPSDSEVRSWYDRNPEVRTSHIFVAAPSGISKEEGQKAIAKLNNVLREIRSGKLSFAEAAQRNSEDASASVGGDLDYRGKDRLDSKRLS